MARRHRIVYRELGELLKRRVRGNPKKHNEERIRESYRVHGFVQPVLEDDGLRLLGAGHGRLKVLDDIKRKPRKGEKVPDGIEVRNGKWYVPTLAGVRFKNRAAFDRYLLMDNRAAEAGWEDSLPDWLARLKEDEEGLAGTGFAEDEANKIIRAGERDGGDQSGDVKDAFQIVVTCKNERQQLALLKRFEREGVECRALI